MSKLWALTSLLIIVSFFTLAQSEHDLWTDGSTGSSDGGGGSGGACAGITLPTGCPINCFRADPVCGVDGVTYWCGCHDALCAGVQVAKLGSCEVGSGGSTPLPGQVLLLVHIVWLILLGFSVLFGLF